MDDLLRTLPQPLPLFALVAGCHHYHFGQFVERGDTLETAMHRMSVACAAHLPPGGRVLDVGCGLGGSSRIFHRLGHACVGIDPCEASIRFAQGANGGDAGPRFEVGDLAAAADGGGTDGGFDALVFLEVLQHLPSLDELLDRALAASRPGATLVFGDLFAVPDLPWSAAPFHRRDGLAAAAAERGLRLVRRRDLTRRVVPTLDHLLVRLHRGRDGMIADLAPDRPAIREEIAELADHCRHLSRALQAGDLVYQLVVLRRP